MSLYTVYFSLRRAWLKADTEDVVTDFYLVERNQRNLIEKYNLIFRQLYRHDGV